MNQDHISKAIFLQEANYNIHMGIGCGCSETGLTRDKTTCYIVTAHHVIGRDINERIPIYQSLLDTTPTCSD